MSAPLTVRVGDWLSTAELSLSHVNVPTVGWSWQSFNLHLPSFPKAGSRRSSFSSLLGGSIHVFSFSAAEAAAHWLYTSLPSCRRVIAGVWPQINTTPSVYASCLWFCSALLWSLASTGVFLFIITVHRILLHCQYRDTPASLVTLLIGSKYDPRLLIFIFKFCSVLF